MLSSIITGYNQFDCVERAKADVSLFLKSAMETDSCMDVFDAFASNLIRELERCFFSACVNEVPFRSKHIKREKV